METETETIKTETMSVATRVDGGTLRWIRSVLWRDGPTLSLDCGECLFGLVWALPHNNVAATAASASVG